VKWSGSRLLRCFTRGLKNSDLNNHVLLLVDKGLYDLAVMLSKQPYKDSKMSCLLEARINNYSRYHDSKKDSCLFSFVVYSLISRGI
jgi:hypothetical protein